jgi:quinol monooxygenase YgiN
METVIVRYRVKPSVVEENEALIAAVFEELRTLGLDGVKYASFKQDDGLSFVHIASFASAEAKKAFGDSKAFQAFTRDIKSRCDVPPEATPLKPLQNFNLI